MHYNEIQFKITHFDIKAQKVLIGIKQTMPK